MSFWADAINGVQTQEPIKPIPRGLYSYNSPIPQAYQQPQQQDYTPTVALSQSSICPGCNSDNYPPAQRVMNGFVQGTCPDCGYHPNFQQSGYGTRSLSSNPGEATPARQVSGGQTMAGSIAMLKAGGGMHI
jgi:hypothetical protein